MLRPNKLSKIAPSHDQLIPVASGGLIETAFVSMLIKRGCQARVLDFSNYQIKGFSMIVAGSATSLGREVIFKDEPAPSLIRGWECSTAKISTRLGLNPSRSVLTAIYGLLINVSELGNLDTLLDEKYYNPPWLEKLITTEKMF
jgi:hypothetical protein